MVKFAKSESVERNITNVSFYQFDATKDEMNQKYDAGIMFGLLTYLQNDKLPKVARNIANAIKPGGRLLVKDTLNFCSEEEVYLYNYATGYSAIYRNLEKYLDVFNCEGLKLLHQVELGESSTYGHQFKSIGFVWGIA